MKCECPRCTSLPGFAFQEAGFTALSCKLGNGEALGVVRKGGLEPPRFYPQVPETCASTSSATFAGTARLAARPGGIKEPLCPSVTVAGPSISRHFALGTPSVRLVPSRV